MGTTLALLNQLNIVVRDMAASVAFYRRLGFDITVDARAQHASARWPGMSLEFDTVEFAKQWDSGWMGPTGSGVVIGCSLASREAVDEMHAALVGAGYRDHQPPYDGFWGARYAIVDDPDGNAVGLLSPIDAKRKFWPPSEPPKAGH